MPEVSSTELFTPDAHAGDSDYAKSHRVRVFRVVADPDAAIEAGWGGLPNPVPQPFALYPGGGQGGLTFPLVAERYSVAPFGDGISTLVSVYYSNDRSGRIRPIVDTTRPGFQAWSINIQKSVQDIPTLKVFPLPVPGATVIEATTPGAEPTIFKAAFTYGVYEITVPIQSLTTAEIELIRSQTDHLHHIGTKWYRFEPGKIDKVEPNVWQVTYSWIGDDGLVDLLGMSWYQSVPAAHARYIRIGATTDRLWYFPDLSPNRLGGTPTVMLRSPFHVLTYALDASFIPYYEQFCPFVQDPDGWRTLPGNLNL